MSKGTVELMAFLHLDEHVIPYEIILGYSCTWESQDLYFAFAVHATLLPVSVLIQAR